LNIYLAELEREGNAKWGGKLGNLIVDSFTFSSEIGLSLIGLALGGSGSAGFASIVAKKVGKDALESMAKKELAKMAGEGATKTLSKQAKKELQQVILSRGALHRYVRPAMKEAAQGLMGGKAAEATAKAGAKLSARAKVGGAVADMAMFALPPTITQTGTQALASMAAGVDAGTVRSNQEALFQVLQGEDPDAAAGLWYGLSDQLIENFSESMGSYLIAPVGKLAGITGLKGMGASFGKAIDKWALETLGRTDIKPKAMFALASKAAKMARQKGTTYSDVMDTFKSIGYDGIFEEMLEERAGGFLRDLFGMEGEDADNAIERAIKNSIPSLEQASLELVGFGTPMVFSAAAPTAFAALGGNFSEIYRQNADLKAMLNAGYSYKEGEKFRLTNEEAARVLVRESMKRSQLIEAANNEDKPFIRAMNYLTSALAGAQYVSKEAGSSADSTWEGGFVTDTNAIFLNTMSLPIGQAAADAARILGAGASKRDADKAGEQAGLDLLSGMGALYALHDSRKKSGNKNDPTPLELEAAGITEEMIGVMSEAGLLYYDSNEGRVVIADWGNKTKDELDDIGKVFTEYATKAKTKKEKDYYKNLWKEIQTHDPLSLKGIQNFMTQGFVLEGATKLNDKGDAVSSPRSDSAAFSKYYTLAIGEDTEEAKDLPQSLIAEAAQDWDSMTPVRKAKAVSAMGVSSLLGADELDALIGDSLRPIKAVFDARARGVFVPKGTQLLSREDGRTYEVVDYDKQDLVLSPVDMDTNTSTKFRVGRSAIHKAAMVGTASGYDIIPGPQRHGLGALGIAGRQVSGTKTGIVNNLRKRGYITSDEEAAEILSGKKELPSSVFELGEGQYAYHQGAMAFAYGEVLFNPGTVLGTEGRHIVEDVIESYLHSLSKLSNDDYWAMFGDTKEAIEKAIGNAAIGNKGRCCSGGEGPPDV